MKKPKKKKTPTYNVTLADIEAYVKKGYEQGVKDSIRKATDYSLAVPVMILRDEYGFGQKRILEFCQKFMDLYDSIDENYLNLQDIVNTIKEETGVEIVTRRSE